MDALNFVRFGFTYAGAADPVLRDVSWSVPQGAFMLLVGDTGSGKTTLLRCIKTEIAPCGERVGDLFLFGSVQAPDRQAIQEESPEVRSSSVHMDKMRSGELHRKKTGVCEAPSFDVGYVTQNPENQIVCDTVWHELAFGLENLGVSQQQMRRRVAELSHFFGIEPWFHAKTESLSSGQKQLVNLASVLVMQPRILLLDEPTAQLDPVAQQNFLHMLFRVNRELGMTLVVATHTPETMLAYATSAARVAGRQVKDCSLDDVATPLRLQDLRPTCEQGQDKTDGFPQKDKAGRKTKARLSAELRFANVYFRYGRDLPWVLRNMTLSLAEGGIHAVVGGNGCGKSTFLCCLASVLTPERGRVYNRLSAEQAFLPQDPQALFVCDTVYDELFEWSHTCDYGKDEVDAMMKHLEIASLAAQHPFDVSGGQQQMIALAKLLLTRPNLLLLDEPTKGLDASAKGRIAHILLACKDAGCTVLVASHDLGFVECVADDAVMLFDGEVAAAESVSEFFANNLFYLPPRQGRSRPGDGRT